MIETLVALFITGLTLGISQCMLSCAPLLLLYITGTVEGWQGGFKAALVFSLARLLAYTLLSALAGGLSMVFLTHFRGETFISWVQLSTGAFILLLGFLIITGHNPHLHWCRYLGKYTLKTVFSLWEY